MLMDGSQPVTISTRYVEKFLNADTSSTIYSSVFKIAGHTFYVLTLVSSNVTLVFDVNEHIWYKWTTYNGSSENYFAPTCITEFNGGYYAIDATSGLIYSLSTSTYADNSNHIYYRIVTDLFDSGSIKRKFYRSLAVVGDKVSATATVSHTGDDYASWSTGRSVDLSTSKSEIFQLGADRRRAWQLLVTDDVALRLDALEIEFDIGGMEEQQGAGRQAARR